MKSISRILMSMTLFMAVLVIVRLALSQQGETAVGLVQEFEKDRVFWQQAKIAQRLVKLQDRSVLPALEPYLKDEDRHVRGNAALVFAGLGDDRGFEVIREILEDRSARPESQDAATIACSSGPGKCPSLQIKEDRYYAAHLFGDLKDARAVPILVPLLKDPDVNYIVPWSLGEIGDRVAIPPLIETLSDKNPDMRVLAIYALEKLGAKEALPRISVLLNDQQRIHFDGLGTVADAAREAMHKLGEP